MENEVKASSNPVFSNLNGVRAIGAILVFVFHLFSLEREFFPKTFQSNTVLLLKKITSHGNLGVNLFYVLSAFLICSLYLISVNKTNKEEIKLIAFLKRRILRLWPLYFLTLGFYLFVFPFIQKGNGDFYQHWTQVLFINNFLEISYDTVATPNFISSLWSIAIEMQFYLLFALFLLAIKTLLPNFKKSQNLFLASCAIIMLISSLVFSHYYQSKEKILYFHTLAHLNEFAIGMILSLVLMNKSFHFSEKVKVKAIWVFLFFTLVIGSFVLPQSLLFIKTSILAVGFAVFIFIQTNTSNTILQVEKIPTLSYLGKISYGIYIYHPIIMFYLARSFHSMNMDSIPYFICYCLLTIGFTLLISSISFRYFESWFLKWK